MDHSGTLTKVIFHGALADRFGAEFDLIAKTPAMAIRGLCVNLNGFVVYVTESESCGIFYECLNAGSPIDTEMIHGPVSGTLELVPVVTGSGGLGRVLIGGALIGASFALPGAGTAVAGVAAQTINASRIALTLGIGLTLQGIAQLLTPGQNTEEVRDESFIFSSSRQTSGQGQTIPLLVGEHFIELGQAIILSSGVDAVDIPVQTITSGGGKGGSK